MVNEYEKMKYTSKNEMNIVILFIILCIFLFFVLDTLS